MGAHLLRWVMRAAVSLYATSTVIGPQGLLAAVLESLILTTSEHCHYREPLRTWHIVMVLMNVVWVLPVGVFFFFFFFFVFF
jgi:hypothetical protein